VSDAEILYSFRVPFQNVLMRGRAQVVKLEASRNGELVAPTVLGSSFSLFDPQGTAIIDAQPITVVDMVATYSITALELPDTIEYSELYQERWVLVMPDGTTRTVPRETAVAPLLLHPVLVEQDITGGEYPDLVAELGDDFDTLQPFMDEAWRRMLEWFFQHGRWPSVMLSTSAFRRPHREWTLFLIFKHLFRNVSGNNRWEKLMDHHKSEKDAALGNLTSRIDKDLDGLPDDAARESSNTVIHRNAHRRRLSSRNPRW